MTRTNLEVVRGSDNPFRDVGLPDADTKLMKADLAAEVIRILRERALPAQRRRSSPACPRPTSPASATPT